ncbi:hypothetical protein QR680_013339 [Steinernema hermaphroditum]|uniref:Sex-determining region Y protein n=1 Tax=Steinernema hermaphroditum TaxID=289476 RepID=A0AA39I6J7_9BILA|nr:hypothetical protein QR680_013339 [Steinernema hermaphroditum]
MDAASVDATPQTPSSRLKKSLAWVCFNSFGDEKRAQCRSCHGVVTWTDAKCTTRTMWWHLYSKHRNQHDKLKILADKLKMTYDGARQRVNFDHPMDHVEVLPSTSDSGEKENELTEIAQFIQEQIDELFASEMGKNADIPSLLTPRPPRRRTGAHLAQTPSVETPMSPMHSNLDVTSEGSRASSPTVDPSLSSPSPTPSDATHEGGFSQHSFVAPQTPMSANGHSAVDFSTPLSPGPNGDQHYIKRPLNAYMMWTREERKKILADDPKKKMHDISREMGERWKSMTDQQKKPYFEKAKAQKAEHKKMLKEHPNWLYQPNKSKGRSKKASPATNGAAAPSTPAPATPSTANGRAAPAPSTPSVAAARNGGTFQRPAPPQAVQHQAPVAAALLSSTSQQPARAAAGGGPMRVVAGPMTAGGAQNVAYHPYAPTQTPRYAQGPNGQTYVVHQNGHPPTAARHTYVAQALAGKPQAPNGYHQAAKPPSMNQVLDMYYTSLCQPAFPEPGETPGLGMAPSNLYLDQYHQMQHQEYLQKYHLYQQQNQFTSSNGLTYQSI